MWPMINLYFHHYIVIGFWACYRKSYSYKNQYNDILKKYGIENKIFKTMADQAANMKKALSEVDESKEIEGGVNEDNLI